MSLGSDLVNVAREARELYKAAKKISKDLDDEASISEDDLNKLEAYGKEMAAVVKELPDDMSKEERRRFIAATKATIGERLKFQDTLMDFEERLKLNAQLFTLENQELKLDLLERFDVKRLIDKGGLDKLRLGIEEAQKQIVKQVKARGYVRLATKFAMLAIDLGLLVAKAASSAS